MEAWLQVQRTSGTGNSQHSDPHDISEMRNSYTVAASWSPCIMSLMTLLVLILLVWNPEPRKNSTDVLPRRWFLASHDFCRNPRDCGECPSDSRLAPREHEISRRLESDRDRNMSWCCTRTASSEPVGPNDGHRLAHLHLQTSRRGS